MSLTMGDEISSYAIKDYSCEVHAINPLSANTFQIDLLVPEGAILGYHAGQYLQLELNLDDEEQAHVLSYSIANNFDSEQPRRIQLFIQNGSEFSARILQHLTELLKHKTEVKVTLPMGRAFLQSPLDAPHVLIASGSGISKIKCIAKEIVEQHAEAKVNIYWANKNVDDFYLLDCFQNWVNTYKNLSFTPILNSAVSGWSGRSGYIYEVVENDIPDLESSKVYLCGSPRMVYGTIDKLKSRGLKEEHCYSDVFEYAPRDSRVSDDSENSRGKRLSV